MSHGDQRSTRYAVRESEEARYARLQFFVLLVLVAGLVVGLGAYFIIQHQRDADREVTALETRLIGQIDLDLRKSIDEAQQFTDYMLSRTEALLREQLKQQVDNAFDLATTIYQRHMGEMFIDRTQVDIRETLRSQRFFHGRGYFYIFDAVDSTCVLMPPTPEREGESFKDQQDDSGTYLVRAMQEAIANPTGGGFVRYRWYAPDRPGEMLDKIAYVRYFQPMDWIIGSGDYVDAMEQRVQEEVITHFRSQKTARGEYIAVLSRDGRVLVSPSTPQSEGKHFSKLPWAEESKLVERLVRLGNGGGGFIDYDWFDPATGKRIFKHSLVTAPNRWGWILVTGTVLDQMQEELAERRAELTEDTRRWVGTTVTVLVIALVVAIALALGSATWLRRIGARYRRSILDTKSQLKEHGRQLYFANFLVNNVSEAVVMADAELRIVYINRFCAAILGAHDDDLLGTRSALLEPMASGDGVDHQYEILHVTADGRRLTLEVTANRIAYEDETFICAVARDVTEKRKAEWDIRLAATAFDNASEGMLITDAANRIVAVNEAFSRITGYAKRDVIGKDPSILSSGRQNAEFYTEMWEILKTTGQWSGEIWNRRKDGFIYPEWLSLRLVRNETGEILNHIAAFTDITEVRRQEERIRHLAQYDFLTDLPNRFLLQDRLERAIANARRHDRKLGLLFVDLDRFKNINDSLGHSTGDKLLRMVGARIAASVRACDTVSRQGGDEFVVLVTDLEHSEAAAVVARKVISVLTTPFDVDGHELSISPSIGIAVFPEDGEAENDLLRNADLAMYSAKDAGRNTFRFFTPELNSRASERLWLENNLRRAIVSGELELHFQPQFAAGSERLIACEALVRWRHPDGQLIPPSQFIPIAEDSGLIIPLGDWVLDNAMAILQAMPGTESLGLAVNLSPNQLRHPGLVPRIRELLVRHDFDPRRLELEVTEGVLMADSDSLTGPLTELRSVGISIAIDDFGTGYSSLSYLRRFHIDRLKIDRSFVNELGSSDGEALVGAIIAMARSLHMETIAEGVETRAQADFLAQAGCDLLQGYLLAKPLPRDVFAALVAAQNGTDTICHSA